MFKTFLDEEQKFKKQSEYTESLSFNQFQKYLYAIGMDFINRQYNSGKKYLFYTEKNPEKNTVTFQEFLQYLNDMSDFTDISKEQYRAALENLDQDGEGHSVQIDDIKRVLKKYGNMTNQ